MPLANSSSMTQVLIMCTVFIAAASLSAILVSRSVSCFKLHGMIGIQQPAIISAGAHLVPDASIRSDNMSEPGPPAAAQEATISSLPAELHAVPAEAASPVASLGAVQPWRIYAVWVQTKDHYKGTRENGALLTTLGMFCSARLRGSIADLHLLAIDVEERNIALLHAVGVKVHNLTHLTPTLKSWYRPVYSKKEAIKHIRKWPNNGVQQRKDGWATYLKFLVWNTTDVNTVMVTDTDVTFHTNPDVALQRAAHEGWSFVAQNSKAQRSYMGLNTHMMILRPSATQFDRIWRAAASGDYMPYTNTEQDVLESLYNVSKATEHARALPRHTHYTTGTLTKCNVTALRLAAKARRGNFSCSVVAKVCGAKL